jgi:DNA-binding response OmpR family regulator
MPSNGKLAGRLVLVLENDYLLADDERSVLEAEGATVLGPFSDSAQAIEAADRARPNCALLDINLGGGPDFVAARELIARGIEIIFVTGYEPAVLPAHLASAPCLQKPFTEETLVAATASVCASRCDR